MLFDLSVAVATIFCLRVDSLGGSEMMICKNVRVGMLAVVAVLALVQCISVARASTVGTISTWNVGSGQPQGNFLIDQYTSFPGGQLEFGQSVNYRQSALYPTVSGNTYTVVSGHQTAGEYGSFATNTARNRWNFNYHIWYEGGISNLDSLTMVITSPMGNTVALPSFNMMVMNNDNVTGSTPWPAGDAQNPAFFIQDSQNPVFVPWFVPTFNMNVEGLYSFTLTATEGSTTVSQTMFVNVVPAPAAATLLGFGGLLTARRRRS